MIGNSKKKLVILISSLTLMISGVVGNFINLYCKKYVDQSFEYGFYENEFLFDKYHSKWSGCNSCLFVKNSGDFLSFKLLFTDKQLFEKNPCKLSFYLNDVLYDEMFVYETGVISKEFYISNISLVNDMNKCCFKTDKSINLYKYGITSNPKKNYDRSFALLEIKLSNQTKFNQMGFSSWIKMKKPICHYDHIINRYRYTGIRSSLILNKNQEINSFLGDEYFAIFYLKTSSENFPLKIKIADIYVGGKKFISKKVTNQSWNEFKIRMQKKNENNVLTICCDQINKQETTKEIKGHFGFLMSSVIFEK